MNDVIYQNPILIPFVVFLGPILEEIVFRGFIYQSLLKRFNVIIATIICSFLFATAHANLKGFTQLFMLSCIFCLVYVRSRNLLYPIAFHILNNTIATLHIYNH